MQCGTISASTVPPSQVFPNDRLTSRTASSCKYSILAMLRILTGFPHPRDWCTQPPGTWSIWFIFSEWDFKILWIYILFYLFTIPPPEVFLSIGVGDFLLVLCRVGGFVGWMPGSCGYPLGLCNVGNWRGYPGGLRLAWSFIALHFSQNYSSIFYWNLFLELRQILWFLDYRFNSISVTWKYK